MFRIVERPRPCSYLPRERASLEITFDPLISPYLYGELLRRGYRRFGNQVFRPVCQSCNQCISVRVLATEHQLSGSERRVMRLNQNIERELAPATVSEEHVDLYNRYQAFMHRERGWALQSHTSDSYYEGFVAGPEQVGWEWRYFCEGKLVGVSLMDVVPNAISLVYFYYDPDWRPKSPGRFSILNQLQFAGLQGIPYAYLGYLVRDCQSLNYKSQYRPAEILNGYVSPTEEPVWLRRDDSVLRSKMP